MRSGILVAKTKVVHGPRSDSALHFDKYIYQIRMEKENASTRRLLPATMHKRCPHVFRFKITLDFF